jgi:hypothetical protein
MPRQHFAIELNLKYILDPLACTLDPLMVNKYHSKYYSLFYLVYIVIYTYVYSQKSK